MARLASQALAGYYALPQPLINPIADLVDVSALRVDGTFAIVDPCAADGAALFGLINAWFGSRASNYGRSSGPNITPYGIELEADRAKVLRNITNRSYGYDAEKRMLHGDAFCATWSKEQAWGEKLHGVSVLYLNPPYDSDQRLRTEHRFLERFTPVLARDRGVLVFVVPFNALKDSATYIATHYDSVHCFRFPEDHFEYRQIVLIARRLMHPLRQPDAQIVAQVQHWAADGANVPSLLNQHRPVVAIAKGGKIGLARWSMQEIDIAALHRVFLPGTHLDGAGLRQLGLDSDLDGLLGSRPFEVAMPPRPGHIAMALASGVLNGAELAPNDPTILPPILAKGVFQREYKVVKERTNKDGDITGTEEVQQPLLRLCALDIASGAYHDIASGSLPSGAQSLAAMNVADLLMSYQDSLGAMMARQCPPIHPLGTPSVAIPMPTMAREPYRAQREAYSALLKLLGRGLNPFLLGEVGTGKSTIALSVINALHVSHIDQVRAKLRSLDMPTKVRQVRRALILCPPHLITSWKDQVAAVLPGAAIVVIESVLDVWADPASPNPDLPGAGQTIYILSRETAKLGSAIDSGLLNGCCPRCGASQPHSDQDVVRLRARCQHIEYRPANPESFMARDLAQLLIHAVPNDPRAQSLVSQGTRRWANRRAGAWMKLDKDVCEQTMEQAWAGRTGQDTAFAQHQLGSIIVRLAATIRADWAANSNDDDLDEAINTLGYLYAGFNSHQHDAAFADVVYDLYAMTKDNSDWQVRRQRRYLRGLALLLELDSATQKQLIGRMQSLNVDMPKYSQDTDPWKPVYKTIGRLRAWLVTPGAKMVAGDSDDPQVWFDTDGRMIFADHRSGYQAAKQALKVLSKGARWRSSGRCNEPLFQAVARPRRYSVARYISRYAQGRFGMLILDEGHEFAGNGSAQGIAAHRLVEMGTPTMLLTGSLMNGYSSGLFRNLWSLSRTFRQEFGRDDLTLLVTRYGYRRILRESDGSDKSDGLIRFGAMTDRQELEALSTVKTLGEAPGVLPILLLQHILPIAVTIQKGDLDDALPICLVETVFIAPDENNPVDVALRKAGTELFREVIDEIKSKRFSKEYAGKLFGALGQLPSFYDRATSDAGNATVGGARAWQVCYPEALDRELVASADLLDATVILPKERWVLEKVESELAEGRNVIIFVTHSGAPYSISPRWARILEAHTGEKAVILEASKVPTAKREDWINREVIGKGRRILIVNPTTVQTGLNNLVWFSTAIWIENPSCNAITFRQANGRLDRIGQTQEVRIFVPVYGDTPQTIAQDLLDRKTLASQQVDGMDVAAAIDASGAGTADAIDVLEMGRAIYKMITGEQI